MCHPEGDIHGLHREHIEQARVDRQRRLETGAAPEGKARSTRPLQCELELAAETVPREDVLEEAIAVPWGDHECAFADLDRDKRNLVELPSREAGGIIFAILDKNAKPDFSSLNDEIVADLLAIRWWDWDIDRIEAALGAIEGGDIAALKAG